MDGRAAKRIALLCVDAPGTRVVEVGAGTGALTRALVDAGARVTAVEIDPDLVGILRARDDLAATEIVLADALTYDPSGTGDDWVAAGNLSYNVATPLITGWVGRPRPPKRVVAMVQRDVADRLTARPGTAAYGSLTLFVAYAMDARRAFTLGPSVFYPRPNVESAVVVLTRHETPPVTVRSPAFLLQVVRAAFAYRRKTLANSLSLALAIDRTRTHVALASLAIDSEIRGEQLDLATFGALADILAP